MHLTFASQSLATLALELPQPVDFAGPKHFHERKTVLTETWGTFRLQELWFEGVSITHYEATLKEPCLVNIDHDNFCWIMTFVLTGEINMQAIGIEPMLVPEGGYYTSHTLDLNQQLGFNDTGELLTICLSNVYLHQLLGNEAAILLNKRNTLVTGGTYRHTKLQTIVNEILKAKQPGRIRRIFLESKILELLSIQLHQTESDAVTKGLNKNDVARLQEAKHIIEQNLQNPFTLLELARKTGLNDFKLKKGFKAIFGQTVFGYLYELRMDTAYQLLKDGKSVSEVAELVGYKNPHHFTAAFKRRFKFLPSHLSKWQDKPFD